MVKIMKSDYRLIPINEENKMLVLEWRNQESVRNNMFDDDVISVENHLNWFRSLQDSKTKVSLVFEHKGVPIGVVNGHEREAEPKKWIWGCFLGNPGLVPRAGTKMGLYAMEYFFEEIGCDIVIGEMIKANTISHKFNLAIGFHIEKDIQIARKNGDLVKSVLLVQTKGDWLKNKNMLFEKAFQGSL